MILSRLSFYFLLCLLRVQTKPTSAPSRKSPSPLPTVLQRQVQGLKALYDATDGANWNLQGQSDDSTEVTIPWSFTIPQENPCSSKWDGVKCSSSEIITSLSLHRTGLDGTLPSEIGRLSELTFLDISSNAIVGSLVPQLFALATLRHLDLGSNLIQGSIPSYVERLSALTLLSLHSNSLTGELSSSLFSLTQLQDLALYKNAFRGSLTLLVGKLSALTSLWLNSNRLTGNLPTALFSLSLLQDFDLSKNLFRGTLSPLVGQLTALTSLWLNSNRFSGELPSALLSLTQLQDLRLSRNAFRGSLSNLLVGQLSALTSLYIYSNSLSGELPSALFSLSQLQDFDLSENAFRGTLSHLVGKLSELTLFSLHSNSLTGELPTVLFSLSKLQLLWLSSNAFRGTLSPLVGQLSALTSLWLDSNSLTGELPSALFSLTQLQDLALNSNAFRGTLSLLVRQLSALTFFSLNSNRLTGELPSALFSLSQLQELWLSRNAFRGTLSPLVGQLSALTYLWLQTNSMTGELPSALLSLTQLQDLRLSRNAFRGSLSNLLVGQLSALTSLYIDANSLTGGIPNSLFSLSNLTLVDVSSNAFTGSLPPLIGSSTSLKVFRCSSNHLTGSIPSELMGLPLLKDLQLSYNSFVGALPPFRSPFLLSLAAANNRLSSTLPPGLFNISTLQSVDLSYNSLSGSIAFPGTAGNLANLRLSWNSLTGSIPPTICTSLPAAESIDVSHNLLSGSPPLCLAHHPKNLQSLSLAANRLSSSTLDFLPQTGNVTLVDISSNSFQGVLPPAFFAANAKTLQTFAAASNCLQGSIPHSICLAGRLTTLILDGLNGGQACRVLVGATSNTASSSSNAFKFTGTKTKALMQGELPSCLFTNLPNLSTLHVSGNGLSGNVFSGLARWPASLGGLSSSHNRLSGTIPAHLQQALGQFRVFDLANNKLGGLLDHVANLSSSAQINLKVNRFSGQLSSAIINLPAPVSVLEGNLFGCATRSQLPDSDAFKSRFECGSDTFNNVLIAFTVVLAVAVAVAAAVAVVTPGGLLWRQWLHATTSPPLQRTMAFSQELSSSLWELRLFLLVAAAAFALVLLPVYGAVNATHGTHTFSYAWTVSAVFVSGEAAAGVFLVIWSSFLVAAYYWLISQQKQHQQQKQHSTCEEQPKGAFSLDGKNRRQSLLLLASRISIFAVNAAFVLPPNLGYVWVVRTQSDQAKTATSLAITVYKQLWGRLVLPFLLKRGGHVFGVSGKGFLFELLLAAFNLILAPALALFTTDSNCFSEALYAPPPVSSSYDTTVDIVSINFLTTSYTDGTSTTEELTNHTSSSVRSELSYVPTFQYGYQCSATLLQAYGPVFLLMALFSCLGEPALLALRTQLEKGDYRVFDVHKLFLTVLQDLLVLQNFGIAAPLLGLALTMSLLLKTLRWQHLISHCNSEAAEDVEADCAEFSSRPHPLFTARWFLVGFSSLFLSFFLLDAAGDAVGWKRAMWAPVLMWSLPTLFALALSRLLPFASPPSQPSEGAAAVELSSLGKRTSMGETIEGIYGGGEEGEMEDQRYRLSEVLDREAMGHADHIPASLRHSGNSHTASPRPRSPSRVNFYA